MQKWQKNITSSILLIFFVGQIIGFSQLLILNRQLPLSLTNNNIQACMTVTTKGDLEGLSNSTYAGGDISINPIENITDALLENFILASPFKFYVQSSPNIIDFSMRNVTLNDVFVIDGSPKISGENVNITGNFESNQYINEKTIGIPTLQLNNVNASSIRFRVSGGSFTWNNSQTSSLILKGFTTALLDSDIILGDLIVEGNGIVTIFNTQIQGELKEHVEPTIIPEQTSYIVPYTFVFQPRAQVNIAWNVTDNIRGPDYDLLCNLTIYKNGQFQQTIQNVSSTSYQLSVDTSAKNYEIRISCKDKQGNFSLETISIVFHPNILWFILMILIVAIAAITSIFLFYRWKQHQWQKTTVVEIPV